MNTLKVITLTHPPRDYSVSTCSFHQQTNISCVVVMVDDKYKLKDLRTHTHTRSHAYAYAHALTHIHTNIWWTSTHFPLNCLLIKVVISPKFYQWTLAQMQGWRFKPLITQLPKQLLKYSAMPILCVFVCLSHFLFLLLYVEYIY